MKKSAIIQRISEWPEEKVISAVLLILAVGLGTLVRLNFIAGYEFPVNDGGFFYKLTSDLVDNRFRLPEFTIYNHAGIPYAYPPLAFYILGGLHKLTGTPIISLLTYVPAVISILTIPVCYGLTRIFFEKELFLRALATYIFATIPRSFEWLVMGGGITRSLGYLFALLALLFFYRALQKNRINVDLFAAGFFSGLTLLSHPVAALFLIFTIGVICIYCWPINLFKLVGVGFLALLLSAPWWVTVLSSHGLSPYLGASNTGHLNWFEAKYLITQNFEFENRLFLALVSMLGILGLFGEPRKRALFMGVYVLGGYLAIPRGGVDLLTVFLAMLAASGFSVVINSWQKFPNADKSAGDTPFYLITRSRVLLIYLVIYTFIGAYTYKYVDSKLDLRISPDDLQAMNWIVENTDQDAIFLHIPSSESHRNWPNDYIGEWLPAITERENLSTVQGYEWLPEIFADKVEQYLFLRSCPRYGISCIEDWQVSNGYHADYLYINTLETPDLLVNNILSSPGYELVFTSGSVTVIKSE